MDHLRKLKPKSRSEFAEQSSRRWLSWFLKALLAIIVLGLLFRAVDPDLFFQALYSVDIGLLLLAVALFFPAQLLAAYRWLFSLKGLVPATPFFLVLRYNMLGQLSARFLPGQISGDLVRAIGLAHGQEVKMAYALSVAIDKIALLAAMAVFAMVGIGRSQTLGQFRGLYWAALSVFALSVFSMLLLGRFRNARMLGWLNRIKGRLPSLLQPPLSIIAAGLESPRLSLQTITTIMILALGLQLMNTVGSYILARSMGIVIDPVDWAAVNAIVAFAQVLPITLGGLGIREGLFAALLIQYQVPVAQSTAYSLMSFLLVSLLLLLGWIALEFFGSTQRSD